MSVNSSSSSNASLPPSPLSFSANLFDAMVKCNQSATGVLNATIFTVTCVLVVLPLSIQVIYLGFQRQQRSGAAMSHVDLFTYHMVVTELLNVVVGIFSCWGVLAELPEMVRLSVCLSAINFNAQQSFHILTCAERYLAVVHPVTYLSLRHAKGVRIRNIIIGCVWLSCVTSTGLLFVKDVTFITVFSLSMFIAVFIFISFCSISVFCVLIRPVPGEGGGARQRVDQSKLRAFYTLMVIQGVLFFRFGGNAVCIVLYNFPQLRENEKCAVWHSMLWCSVPSSLVLPLLFLHRAGKLCCRNNSESD